MKNNKFWFEILTALSVGVWCLLPVGAYADGCATETYSLPNDFSGAYPLTKPGPELARTIDAASKGIAVEQRNLAASYESGYGVGKCLEKATFWYRHAAKGGDKVAKKWIAERDMQDRLAAGPECLGTSCDLAAAGMPQIMSLIADSRGHFHSALSINGMAVDGIIDTGATLVTISSATASYLGIPLTGGKAASSMTANGVITTINKVIPSLKVGNIVLDNVEIGIAPNTPTLIGMSVLRRLRMSAANGQMTLSQ